MFIAVTHGVRGKTRSAAALALPPYFMETSMHENAETFPSDDEIYARALALVLEHRQASVALVQRHLRLGYAKACALFERMQVDGLVAPAPHTTNGWVLIEKQRDSAS